MLPVNTTVPLLVLNVPPVLVQLPETLNVVEGAVSTPEDKLTLVTVTIPVEPVNVPPATVKPPLSV